MQGEIWIVGSLFVAAIWDIGRRWTDKNAAQALSARLNVLASKVAELEEMPEQVAELGTKVQGLSNTLQSQKAVANRNRWPAVR
jgi:cell division protein FtsB